MTQLGADTTNLEATVRGEQMLRKTPSSERGSIDSRPTEAEATDEVQLTFLIPSNERHTQTFNISDTVQHAKQTLLDNWPVQLGPKPASPSDLKLLYGGNFLDNNTTLDAVKRYADAPTVVHLMISRGKASEKEVTKDTDKAPKCSCIIL